MFKRNSVVKFVDSFGIEHAAKVEAESLFEAAVRGLHRLDSLRVFETTFYVNASDVLDGSEKLLYLPSAFTDLKEMAQQ